MKTGSLMWVSTVEGDVLAALSIIVHKNPCYLLRIAFGTKNYRKSTNA